MDLRVVLILAALGIVQCKLISSCNITKTFVDGHNARRLKLARGTVSGQPAASKMNYLIWDEELATKASNWAAKNKWGHNPDRTVPSGRFGTGENIFKVSTTNMGFSDFDVDSAMASWWEENKDFTYHKLSMSDFTGSKQVGHYTQMACSNSIRLGCGISHYIENGWNNFYVVCNYGPTGNYLGQTPYESDNGAGMRLECGESNCNHKYGDHC